jgi:hypothetical protein
VSQTTVYELVGGPHDGGQVRGPTAKLIFLERVWLGKAAFSTWSEAGSGRFPCRYSQHNGRYYFAGWY